MFQSRPESPATLARKSLLQEFKCESTEDLIEELTSLIECAASDGNLKKVNKLLEKCGAAKLPINYDKAVAEAAFGATFGEKDAERLESFYEIMKQLFACGAKANYKSPEAHDVTPLLWVASNDKYIKFTKLLLDNQADIHAMISREREGVVETLTALEIAINDEQPATIELLQAKLNENKSSPKGP